MLCMGGVLLWAAFLSRNHPLGPYSRRSNPLAAIRSPAIAQRLADAGLRGPMGTDDCRKKLDAEFARWVPFLREAGLSAR